MQIHRPSKLKVVSLTVVFALALVMAQPRPAHACLDPFTFSACVFAAVVAAAVTVVAVKAVICTPVAAFNASDHQNGFTGAYGDCFRPNRSQTTAVPVEKDYSVQLSTSEPEALTQPSADSASADEPSETPAQ